MDLDKKTTKKIKKTDLSITLLLLIGIIIVANFFSYQLFYRWDLTQDKIYSVSKATKNTLGGLDDIVNIKAYFSNNLPSQVLSIKQEVADILDEYAAYSNGKVRVEFIDPLDNEETQRELYTIGIPQLTFEVYEKDKRELVNGYMGIAISYGDNTEAIPAIKRNTSDLEYQLTTAIKKVTSDEIATIGFLTSHGSASLENELKIANQELAELYTIRQVALADEEPSIPVDIDTLIIMGPEEEFSEDQLKAINSFIMRGGSLLALINGVKIGEGLVAQKNSTGLEGLLEKYGIKINQDLVADVRSGVASFTQGFMTFSSSYPFWPKMNTDGFNAESSAVANLESVIMPWASSIEIDPNKITEGVTNLVFTTNQSWHVTDNFNVAPNQGTSPQGERKSYNLAVLINSNLANPYAEEGEPESGVNNRIIVVGDADFATDGFIQNSPDNLILFQNLVDTLSFDEDLISIRSKGATSRPIKEDMSEASKAGIRYFNVLGLTVLVLIFGLARYFMRRRSRFVDEL